MGLSVQCIQYDSSTKTNTITACFRKWRTSKLEQRRKISIKRFTKNVNYMYRDKETHVKLKRKFNLIIKLHTV